MEIETIYYIKNNPLAYNYLREDSSWYQRLNRGEDVLPIIENLAKKFYKQTPEDKIAKLSKNENVNTEILLKICNALNCDISDIMEVVKDSSIEKEEN